MFKKFMIKQRRRSGFLGESLRRSKRVRSNSERSSSRRNRRRRNRWRCLDDDERSRRTDQQKKKNRAAQVGRETMGSHALFLLFLLFLLKRWSDRWNSSSTFSCTPRVAGKRVQGSVVAFFPLRGRQGRVFSPPPGCSDLKDVLQFFIFCFSSSFCGKKRNEENVTLFVVSSHTLCSLSLVGAIFFCQNRHYNFTRTSRVEVQISN